MRIRVEVRSHVRIRVEVRSHEVEEKVWSQEDEEEEEGELRRVGGWGEDPRR